MEEVVLNIGDWESGETIGINNRSDVEGYIYPKVQITIKEAGDLILYNEMEDRTSVVYNCSVGEVITMEYPMINTSNPDHLIQNDFNWTFLRLANTYSKKLNKITSSLACSMRVAYTPYVQIGL